MGNVLPDTVESIVGQTDFFGSGFIFYPFSSYKNCVPSIGTSWPVTSSQITTPRPKSSLRAS